MDRDSAILHKKSTKTLRRHSQRMNNMEKVDIMVSNFASDDVATVSQSIENVLNSERTPRQSARKSPEKVEVSDESPLIIETKMTRRSIRKMAGKSHQNKVPNSTKSSRLLPKDTIDVSIINSTLPETPRNLPIGSVGSETPRRSGRKSIKPLKDYDEIIEKRNVKLMVNYSSFADGEEESLLEANESVPKWTPAKVGRVSQKRPKRSKSIAKKIKLSESDKCEDVASVGNVTNDCNLDEKETFKQTIAVEQIVEKSNNDDTVLVTEGNNTFDVETDHPDEPISELNLKTNDMIEDLIISVDIELERKVQDEITNDPNSTKVHEMNEPIIFLDSEVEVIIESTNELNTMSATNNGDQIASVDTEVELKSTTIAESGEPILSVGNEVVKEVQDEPMIEKNSTTVDKIDDPIIHVEKDNQDNEAFGFSMNSKLTNFSDLGLDFLEMEMPPLIVCDDSVNNSDDSISKSTLNSTFNKDDCLIDVVEPRELLNKHEAHSNIDGETMQKLQLSEDEHEEDVMKTTIDIGNIPRTPIAKRSKIYRVPTPYKAKGNEVANKKVDSLQIVTTSLQPKDIVLRSIRKRSNSFSIKPSRTLNHVTFYSPANQTVVFDGGDELMAKSTNSTKINDSNVTKRRKRSLSLDEAMYKRSKIPRPGSYIEKVTPIKTTKLDTDSKKQTKRTKLPNFAAIHQKQFNRMENLVEHVVRKAERAKVLTHSGGKLRTVSAQTPDSKHEKSKAHKFLNMDENNTTIHNETIKKTTKLFDKEFIADDIISMNNLPNPRIIKPLGVSTQPISKNVVKSTNAFVSSLKQPTFNLSTALQAKPIFCNTAQQQQNREDKSMDRQQRHMAMFKGRTATSTKRNASTKEPAAEIIRGVRSNRRFQLQMQHRRNIEEN